MLSNVAQQLMAAQDLPSAKAFLAESLQFLRLDGDVVNRLTQILQPQQPQVSPQQFQELQQQLQQLQEYIKSGEADRTKSETHKNLATAAKTLKDANISDAQVPKVRAETIKTLEEAKRTGVEAHMTLHAPKLPQSQANNGR